MAQPHPGTGETYKINAREDGAFEVEVTVPMAATPVIITGLQTRDDAERWIAKHREAIAAGAPDSSRAPSGPIEPR